MTKFLVSLAAAGALLAGCVSTAPTATPQALAAQVCPTVQEAVALGLITDKTVITTVATACTLASTTTGSLQDLVNTALPVILTAVQSSNLPDADKQRITGGLLLAQFILIQNLGASK